MSKKMQGRVLLCGHDMDMLKPYFPSQYLPEDFGGSIPNSNASKMTERIKKAAKQIEKDYSYLSKVPLLYRIPCCYYTCLAL